jgi:hypothetical protein
VLCVQHAAGPDLVQVRPGNVSLFCRYQNARAYVHGWQVHHQPGEPISCYSYNYGGADVFCLLYCCALIRSCFWLAGCNCLHPIDQYALVVVIVVMARWELREV